MNRKIFLFGFGFILLVFSLVILVQRLSDSTLVIKTHDKNAKVIISKYDNIEYDTEREEKTKKYTLSGESITKKLKPGFYWVRIEKSSGETINKRVDLKRRKTVTIDVPIYTQHPTEQVLNKNSLNVYANGDVLRYFKKDVSKVFQLPKTSVEPQILLKDLGSLYDVKWFDNGSAVLMSNKFIFGFDSTTNKHSFINTEPQNDDIGDSGQVQTYDVNPEGSDFIAAYQNKVYHFNNINDQSPRSIADYKKEYIGAIYGNKKLLLFSNAEGSSTGKKSKLPVYKNIVVDVSKNNSYEFESYGIINSARWSPGAAKILAYTTREGLLYTFDTVDKKPEKALANNADRIVWKDEHTVFYTSSNSVWELDIDSGSSKILGTVDKSLSITSLFYNKGLDYIYFTATAQQSVKSGIYRISVSNKQNGRLEIINKLSNTVPYITKDYELGLNYFGDIPIIYVTLRVPEDQNTDYIKKIIMDKLSSTGVNIGSIKIVYLN